MNQKILLAYLFSRLRINNLTEFFRLIDILESGCSIFHRDFQKQSLYLRSFFESENEKLWKEWLIEIEQSLEAGIQFTFPGDLAFPQKFLSIEYPPFFLSYRGMPVWLARDGLSIVGSRHPSLLAENWCELHINELLKNLRIPIISGGAYGIDQIAHRIAIRNRIPTVVVLPSGLNQLYPQTLDTWVEPILEQNGVLLSEYLPSIKMQKHFFQQRNRLIAGLSVATLIIEAKRKSGTLITAKQALEQGRPLFVLPSHPLDYSNLGALDLLMEGATPILEAQDLIMLMRAELNIFSQHSEDLVLSWS